MNKVSVMAMALFVVIALSACTEVPVRRVTKCAKVVDVKMAQKYLFGIIPKNYPDVYRILDNGKRVEISENSYYEGGSADWFETTKKMEIGNNYCWTEYEMIK